MRSDAHVHALFVLAHSTYSHTSPQVGFKLGEDLASTNCVLVHSSVKNQIEAVGGLSGFSFELSDPVDIEGTKHEVWSVKWREAMHAVPVEDGESSARTTSALRRWLRRLLCCGGGGFGRRRGGDQEPLARRAAATSSELTSFDSITAAAAGETGGSSHLSVINAEVNQEEPLDLITMLDERIECVAAAGSADEEATKAALARIDARIISRFSRSSITVLVMMIHVKTPGYGRGEELATVGTVLDVKGLAHNIVSAHGGSCVKAMQNRTVPAVFALMPTALAALESTVLLYKRCEAEYRAHVVLQVGMATGEVLDFEGCNTFGDPVNTAFKLGEDVAERWEIALDMSTFNELPAAIQQALPFREKAASISGVSLAYRSIDSASAEGREAAGRVAVVSGIETGASSVLAACTPGMLDWTGLVGKGVKGLKMPYGGEQEKAAVHVQKIFRAASARKQTMRQRNAKRKGKLEVPSLKSKLRLLATATRVVVRTSRTMKAQREWNDAPWSVDGQRLLNEKRTNGYGLVAVAEEAQS